MQLARRLRQLSTLFATVLTFGCSSEGSYVASGPQYEQGDLLTAAEVRRVLTGNTIIGTRDDRRYWVYHPTGAAMWGLESTGDVDIGSWHLEGNRYCRAWRRWHDAREKCWQLAVNTQNQLVWLDESGQAVGASQLQAGNTLGLAATPQQVMAYLDPDMVSPLELDVRELARSPQEVRPLADSGPVDAFGILLVPQAGSPREAGERGAGEPGILDPADLAGPSIVGGSKLVDRRTIAGGSDEEGGSISNQPNAAADSGAAGGAAGVGGSAEADADIGVGGAVEGAASADAGGSGEADADIEGGGVSADLEGGAEANVDANAGEVSAGSEGGAAADVDAGAGGASADVGGEAAADVGAGEGL